jgi:hypothetical protein
MGKRHQVTAELMRVNIILQLAAEKFIVELVGRGQVVTLDRVGSTQERLGVIVATRL